MKKWVAPAFAAAAIAYGFMGYGLDRTQFGEVAGGFALLMLLYAFFLKYQLRTQHILIAGIAFRAIFFFAYPRLSDDYYRFIWDGRLCAAGISPFAELPSQILADSAHIPGISEGLYKKLNSPHYYSVYPPVCQLVFWISAELSPPHSLLPHLLWMRLFILAAEALSMYILWKLLRHYRLPESRLAWYALNPLVIVELCGNLHFEALLILGLALGLYALLLQKPMLAGAGFALGILAKLQPLMLFPLLLRRLWLKQAVAFYSAAGLTLLLGFLPFLEIQTFEHIMASVRLYFLQFEFNASIYYIVRWIGFEVVGHNIIEKTGKVLPWVPVVCIAGMAAVASPNASSLYKKMLAALLIYLLVANIVHPWYVAPLVFLAPLSGWRWPLAWSGCVVLSYQAYESPIYEENLWLVGAEYTILLVAIVHTMLSKETNRSF